MNSCPTDRNEIFVQKFVSGTTFEVLERYADLAPVGMGAFGLVSSAKDTISGDSVAVKKITNPTNNAILAKRTYRELKLLANLKHPNIISLKDAFFSPSNDIYFVTDLMGTDMSRLIHTRKLEREYMQYFTFQIVRALKYLHSAGVVHRDLKPSNILINEDCVVKLCDFGLARSFDSQMTGYVATRYYRAPEIMLNWQRYDYAIDLWSVGCIIAEMHEGKPLFPGRDHVSQFKIITELLGSPEEEILQTIASENTLKFVRSLPHKDKLPFSSFFSTQDKDALDIMEKLLVFNPKKRLTAVEALEHPYLKQFSSVNENLEADFQFDWSFANQDFPMDTWEDMLRDAINEFIEAKITK